MSEDTIYDTNKQEMQVEELHKTIDSLSGENQKLRDTIYRLREIVGKVHEACLQTMKSDCESKAP